MSTKRIPQASALPAGRTAGQWLASLEAANPALRAQQLLRLNRAFVACLPPALARQSGVSNFRDGVLVVHAHAGPAAHRLRLMAPTLLEALRGRGVDATELRVVAQPRTSGREPPTKQAVLTPAAAEGLSALAAGLPPSTLRSALERLAGRHRSPVKPRG